MGTERWIELSLTGLSLALTAFASGAEAAIMSANPFRVRRMAREKVAAAELVDSILDREEWYVSALLILKNGALIVATCLTTVLGFSYAPRWGTVAAIVSLTLLVLFLCRLIPRAWATRDPERAALILARPIRWLAIALYPFIRFFNAATGFLIGQQAREELPQDAAAIEAELQLFMDAGEEEGYIEEDERQMITSICDFDVTLVREIMVPRIDIVALEAGASIDAALDVILETGYSRIPVYEGTIENIVGILNAKDLLTHLRNDGRSRPELRSMLRAAQFVPETKQRARVAGGTEAGADTHGYRRGRVWWNCWASDHRGRPGGDSRGDRGRVRHSGALLRSDKRQGSHLQRPNGSGRCEQNDENRSTHHRE